MGKYKGIFYVLIFISVLSLVIAVVMFMARQKEEALKRKAEEKLADIIQQKNIIKIELKKTKQEKDELEKELRVAKAKMQQLDNELTSVSKEMGELKSNLAKQTIIAEELRQQLEEEKNMRSSLSNQLELVQMQKQELESRFADLKIKKEELEKEFEEADEEMKIQLDKVVVASGKSLPARILVVNKDYNFVIINLGSDKVLKNSVLGIYRYSKNIGKVEVEKVYPNMCSAKIIDKIVPFKAGDSVKILEQER